MSISTVRRYGVPVMSCPWPENSMPWVAIWYQKNVSRSNQKERTTRRVHPGESVAVVSEPPFAPDLPGGKQAEQRGGREVLHVQPGKEAGHETKEHPGPE